MLLIGAGALVAIAAVIYFRRAGKTEEDPEAGLRELLGPSGLAARDLNRAKADAKWNNEFFAAIEKNIASLKERGDLEGAEKLERYYEDAKKRRG